MRSIKLIRREVKPEHKLEEQLIDASEKVLLGIETPERFNRLKAAVDYAESVKNRFEEKKYEEKKNRRQMVEDWLEDQFGNIPPRPKERVAYDSVMSQIARRAAEIKTSKRSNVTPYNVKNWHDLFDSTKIGDEKYDNFDSGKLSMKLSFKKTLFGDELSINTVGLQEYENLLVNAIIDIIAKLNLGPNDRINVIFTGPSLKQGSVFSGVLTIGKMRSFNDWKHALLDNFIKIINSNGEVMFDNLLTFTITYTRIPSGSGRVKGISFEEKIKDKTSIVEIKNTDHLCFDMAVIVADAKLRFQENLITDNQYAYIRKNECNNLQKQAAVLRQNAKIPEDKPINYANVPVYEELLKRKIHIVEAKFNNHIICSKADYNTSIYVLFADCHYDAIVNIVGYFGQQGFCEKCMKSYKNVHNCNKLCKLCHSDCRGKDNEGKKKRCDDCKKEFYWGECFEEHLNSVCSKFCKSCKCLIKKDHKCGFRKCLNCKNDYQYMIHENNKWKRIAEPHKCFMQKVVAKESSDKYIFFDFETMQETGKHIVNYCSTLDFEGNRKDFERDPLDENGARNDFCKWAISEEHKGYTFIAHNGRGYDFIFVRKYLIDLGYSTDSFKIVYNGGSKIMLLAIPRLKIRFIDSLSFFPSALRKLPKTFGITEVKKGFFPHFFNTVANQNYIGEIPDKKHFGIEHFDEDETKEFNGWYDKQLEEKKEYNFIEELKAYCFSDVDVLRHACIKFRTEMLNLMNVDPFQYVTTPSTCMAIYKSKFMKENTIAIVPPYRVDKQSDVAINWMEMIMAEEGIHIQHAYNSREFEIRDENGKRYPVDGYCKESNTIYEFYGDEFHGCPKHKQPDHISKVKHVKYSQLQADTLKKEELIRRLGYNLVTIYECEFKEFKKGKESKAKELENIDITKPLNPRDAMFGGRVNAIKLLYKFKQDEYGQYFDITSLYPTVMFYDWYPVGHPTRINNTEYETGTHHGLVKCRVLPPRGLYIPVLPYKCEINGAEKLLFPLCRSCIGSQNNVCSHSDTERSMVGTWTSFELTLALHMGYKILKTFEIWHWSNWTTDMFKEYIKKFMQIKQEASGYPEGCNSDEEKKAYIQDFKDKTGIQMDPANIVKNDGKREIAKLCLNNLWGKFGQNTNKDATEYVTDRNRFFNVLRNSHLNVKSYDFLNERLVEMRYNKADNCDDESYMTNIYIAIYTTSNARIRLYDALHRIGDKILYFDTDSVMFIAKEGERCPLEGLKGDNLGQFKDELKGKGNKMIGSFVATAPKSYGYELENGKKKFKIKGFTLNYENSKILNYDSMKACMINNSVVTLKNDHFIKRDNKTKDIVSVKQEKIFKFCYDKRKIIKVNDEYIDTLPYGF